MRPVRESLREGVDRHHDERGEAKRDGEGIELNEHQKPEQRLRQKEGPRLTARNLTGGQGAAEADVARAIASAEHVGRIDRTGRIPVADLARHLADADVVAFPSTYEGFGIPVLEAMAAGVAVLVADGTPAADLVQGCDAIVGAGDPAAWAEALDRLLAERGHRTALAARVLAAARDRTWEASAAALERAWRLLLAGSAPAGRGT